jgi:hypothetical protein
MAMHMERIEAFLESEGLKYRFHDQGHLLTGFRTESYRSADGLQGMAIAVRLTEGGEYLECIAPALYDATDCPRPEELFRLLVSIMGRSKMIRFEFDPDDNEIRASIECALEDGCLTKRQFLRMLQALPELVDKWDPAIRAAIAGEPLPIPSAAAPLPDSPVATGPPAREAPPLETTLPPAAGPRGEADSRGGGGQPENTAHDSNGDQARSARRSRP